MDRGEETFCKAAMAALEPIPLEDTNEICGAACPECDMIEARPGCCILPRDTHGMHECGKHSWLRPMTDTSSETSSSDTSSSSGPELSEQQHYPPPLPALPCS